MSQEGAVFLGVFALIGFLLKIAILFNISVKSKIAECFTILCFFFLFQNVAEFLAYFTYLKSPELGQLIVHLYVIALYFIFPSVLILALALTESRYLKSAQIILYSIAGLITAAHLGGYTVAGIELQSWTATTVKGEYFWVVLTFVLACLALTTGILGYNFHYNNDFEIKSRCKVNFLAFAPLLLVSIAVAGLKMAGYPASIAVSMPIATVIFLFVMLLQTNGNLFWISLRLKIILTVATMKKIDTLEDILGRIEELRIREALKATNGKQKSAAILLNVPASTLCKKINKYNINREAV